MDKILKNEVVEVNRMGDRII